MSKRTQFLMGFPAAKVCRLMLWSILHTLVCLPYAVPAQAAESDESLRKKLSEEQAVVLQEQEVLTALQTRRSEMEQEIADLAVQLKELEERERVVAADIQNIESEEVVLESTIADLQKEETARLAKYYGRLKAMYKLTNRAGPLHYLIESESASDLVRRVHDLRFMVRYDFDGLSRLQGVIRRLDATRDEIAQLKRSKGGLLQELANLKKSLEDKRVRESEVLEEITKHEATQKTTLAGLKKSIDRMEASLAKLLDERATVAKQEALPKPLKGGIRALKGRLPFPVKGKIIQGFGKRKHETFSDELLVKGLEMQAPPASDVRAIAAGRILFRDELPNYGRMVIVDHGDRYYSLYAKISDIYVSVGDLVEPGAIIAKLPKQVTSDDHGNFYFELRLQGRAIDPEAFFSKSASF